MASRVEAAVSASVKRISVRQLVYRGFSSWEWVLQVWLSFEKNDDIIRERKENLQSFGGENGFLISLLTNC